MKNYIKQWQIESESTPGKYYTVSLDYDGNFSCSCPHWIYRHKECKHIEEAKYLMNDMEEYIYLLSRWKKAIADFHQEGIWDDLYKDAQKIDLTVTHVQLKLALADEEIDKRKVEEVIAALGLPLFPTDMRDRIVPLVINLKEYDPEVLRHQDVLKEIEKTFNNREKLTTEIVTSNATFTFEFKPAKKKGEYHPMMQMHSNERGYYHFRRYDYHMLTPYIGAIKPVKIKKSQTAGV